MGVAKTLELNTGITITYWRLNQVSVDIEKNVTSCRVGGYALKADALAGKAALKSINYSFQGSNNPIGIMTDPREYQTLLYSKIIGQAVPFITNELAGGEIVSDMP